MIFIEICFFVHKIGKMSTSFQRNQDSSSSSDEYKQQQQQRQHSGAWKPKKKNIQQNFHFSKSVNNLSFIVIFFF